jgi:hypothetical protein
MVAMVPISFLRGIRIYIFFSLTKTKKNKIKKYICIKCNSYGTIATIASIGGV